MTVFIQIATNLNLLQYLAPPDTFSFTLSVLISLHDALYVQHFILAWCKRLWAGYNKQCAIGIQYSMCHVGAFTWRLWSRSVCTNLCETSETTSYTSYVHVRDMWAKILSYLVRVFVFLWSKFCLFIFVLFCCFYFVFDMFHENYYIFKSPTFS